MMEKKNPVGRPAVEEKRKTRTFKATDGEWQLIQQRAASAGLSASEFIRLKALGGIRMNEVKYGLYVIVGDRAEEAADALDREERNLDYLYEGIAPDRTGYEEAKVKIFTKICQDFEVVIR